MCERVTICTCLAMLRYISSLHCVHFVLPLGPRAKVVWGPNDELHLEWLLQLKSLTETPELLLHAKDPIAHCCMCGYVQAHVWQMLFTSTTCASHETYSIRHLNMMLEWALISLPPNTVLIKSGCGFSPYIFSQSFSYFSKSQGCSVNMSLTPSEHIGITISVHAWAMKNQSIYISLSHTYTYTPESPNPESPS